MQKILLNIASPKNVLMQDEVEMAVLPGLYGDIGITFGERTFSFILKPGIVYLFQNNKVFKRYFIMGGNFLAYDNKLYININDEMLFDLNSLDRDKIFSCINEYKKLLDNNTEEVAKLYYKNKILHYEEVLNAAKSNYYN